MHTTLYHYHPPVLPALENDLCGVPLSARRAKLLHLLYSPTKCTSVYRNICGRRFLGIYETVKLMTGKVDVGIDEGEADGLS